jgi:4-amino-4-deoxy-L-arabinose transferase-like glycosyltransferase
MRASSSSRSADVAIAVALFVIASVTFLRAAESVPFHGDESEWINAGRYFKYLFLDGDTSGEVWRPSFLTRDQPALGRYVIGGIVWAAGNDLTKVNRSYAWNRDRATNARENRIPGPELLTPVRTTMAVVSAFSVVGLFVVGRLLDGQLAGAVAALAVTFSPLVQLYFVQARTEALLFGFTVPALIGTLLVARRFAESGRIPAAGYATGLLLGLALATKLTAGLAIVGTVGYGSVAALERLGKSRGELVRMAFWTASVGLLAALIFVVTNPFLWPDPIRRTYSLLTQQQEIMVEQGEQFGGAVQEGAVGRVGIVILRTFVENATPSFDEGLPAKGAPVWRKTFLPLPTVGGLSVELSLATIGLGALGFRAARSWRGGGRPGMESAFLCWIVIYFGGIAANLSLDWPRYYVPTAYLGALLIGVGAAVPGRAALAWLRARSTVSARARERSVGTIS